MNLLGFNISWNGKNNNVKRKECYSMREGIKGELHAFRNEVLTSLRDTHSRIDKIFEILPK